MKMEEASNATKIKARRKKTKSDVSAREVSVGYDDQRLREVVTGNTTSLRESEQGLIEILIEQNRLQASRIQRMEADSSEDRANFKAQLQEFQSKVDSLESEKQTLLERNEILTEQNKHQAKFLVQVEYFLSHPASIVCILAIIVGVCLLCNNMASENHLLRERNAALTEQNNRQSSRIENLYSEKLLLHDQILLANQLAEFLRSQITSMRVEFKENNDKVKAVRLKESQFNLEGMNYLVRCLRDENSASERFTGISLFWGAVQVGYTTRSGLDNCLTMYQAHYHRQGIS